MKVAVLQGQEQLSMQIQRSLQAHQIKGDLISRINNRVLTTYDFLIVSSEQQPKITVKVLEQIILQKQIVLVYIHHQSNLNTLYNLLDDPFFLPIYKANVVETLPSMLITIFKWQNEVRVLKTELNKVSRASTEAKNIARAKQVLINSGMLEEEAHIWIQKAAMDRRCKKSDIVNLIIQEKIDIE